MPHSQYRLLGTVATLAILSFCAALYLLVPPETLRSMIDEGGFFEAGSAVGWFVAAAVLVWLGATRQPRRPYLLGGVITALLGMRELDWHKAFTTDSLLKTNYYLKTPAPLAEKLAAAAVVLAIAALLVYFLTRYGRLFLRQLWSARPAALTLAHGLGLLVLSKIIDRSVSVLKDDMNMEVADWFVQFQAAFEEPLEFFLPIMVLLAVWQYASAAAIESRGKAAAGLSPSEP